MIVLHGHQRVPDRLGLVDPLLRPPLVVVSQLGVAVRPVLLLGIVLAAGDRARPLAAHVRRGGGGRGGYQGGRGDAQRRRPSVHQGAQRGGHGASPARVGALAVQFGRLVGLGETVRQQDPIDLAAHAIIRAQAGRRPLRHQRVAVQALRRRGLLRGPGDAFGAPHGVSDLRHLLGGQLRLHRRRRRGGRGGRRPRGPAVLEAVRPLQVSGRLDDELDAIGAFVVDAAPAHRLREVPDHGPWHAGQVAQVTRLSPGGGHRGG